MKDKEGEKERRNCEAMRERERTEGKRGGIKREGAEKG